MKKVIRNGKVAVLYSPGFGAGWITWDAPREMIFDPEVVALVEAEEHHRIESVLRARGYSFYMRGADDLIITWVPEGQKFRIREYDGSESLEYLDENDGSWITA